jgi:hypothetical protein
VSCAACAGYEQTHGAVRRKNENADFIWIGTD